ncbi:3,4-dihydroxy-2-butanone-4-phosphate synthase [Brachybacterium squillarum]|uniref:3,4-dihydroxy-2-butanone-4-phosphate synthase n=1 Tax=Brachybacterium squillarum TaxID=661979 RepID=UPI0002629407|nr:3,4-dihydroxy-2-butanone-4-phosphate synthase [Brachybacterium squillarum]
MSAATDNHHPAAEAGERLARALDELRAGRPVLVADGTEREDEVDAVMAAEHASERWIGWMVRRTSGYLCAPLPADRADALGLPPMVPRGQDPRGTAYTVAVDAADGVTTGISAADRARTLRVLADPDAAPADLIRPGHVLPLRAVPGGVHERPGHTEAAVDLCRAAGLVPVGVIGELVHDEGPVLRREAAARLAAAEHLALVAERPVAPGAPTPVRVHSECLTGEALGSARCDCGPQLEAALEHLAAHGGVLVYLRGHEGRGIGLAEKIAAYALQDAGHDTVEANRARGWPVDAREYGAAAAILTALDVTEVELLGNNPDKAAGLRAHGIAVVAQRPLIVGVGPENVTYLRTKAQRMGHRIPADALTPAHPRKDIA